MARGNALSGWSRSVQSGSRLVMEGRCLTLPFFSNQGHARMSRILFLHTVADFPEKERIF